MTTTYDNTGLTVDTADQIKTDLENSAKSTFGEGVNLAPDSFFGHSIEQFARVLGTVNQALQAMYNGFSIPNASGVPLATQVQLIGLEKQSEAYSKVTLALTATKATTVNKGSLYGTVNGINFATDETLVFSVPGVQNVTATCVLPGPYEAAIGEISRIVTSVYGITIVTNQAAATLGRNTELDSELKIRHSIATATSGEDDVNTIYEAVSGVDGVSGVYVEENDIEGYVAVYVIGGSAEDIATAINNNRTGGVATYGTSSYSLYNPTTKITKTINYTVGEELDIYVNLNITAIPGTFPDDGEQQIKDNIVAEFASLKMHDTVEYSRIFKPVFSVPGLIVNSMTMGPAGNLGTININTNKDEKPVFSVENITIVIS